MFEYADVLLEETKVAGGLIDQINNVYELNKADVITFDNV